MGWSCIQTVGFVLVGTVAPQAWEADFGTARESEASWDIQSEDAGWRSQLLEGYPDSLWVPVLRGDEAAAELEKGWKRSVATLLPTVLVSADLAQ